MVTEGGEICEGEVGEGVDLIGEFIEDVVGEVGLIDYGLINGSGPVGLFGVDVLGAEVV